LLRSDLVVSFLIYSLVELYIDKPPLIGLFSSSVRCAIMNNLLVFFALILFSPSIKSSISRGVKVSDIFDIVVRLSDERKNTIRALALSSESLELLRIVLTEFSWICI